MITLRNYWWIKTAVSKSYCKLVRWRWKLECCKGYLSNWEANAVLSGYSWQLLVLCSTRIWLNFLSHALCRNCLIALRVFFLVWFLRIKKNKNDTIWWCIVVTVFCKVNGTFLQRIKMLMVRGLAEGREVHGTAINLPVIKCITWFSRAWRLREEALVFNYRRLTTETRRLKKITDLASSVRLAAW